MSVLAGLHELFERQADRTPAAPAVVDAEGAVLGYGELERRANRLAHGLRRRGVGREARVAVAMARSPELVVALLGVLKAGAVYVPLDPGHPRDRLAFQLEDARATLLLAGEVAQAGLAPAGTTVIVADRALEAVAGEPDDRPRAAVRPDDLAYVIYTSGSTGRPKGVMVPHRAVRNHTEWFQDVFRLTPADRLLHKTPIGFDPSITEFMAPLVAGGQLVLARPDGHQDPSHLVETIIARRVTALQMVPTLLGLLLDQPRLAACESLRLVLSGGEALPVEMVRRLRAVLPVAIHNLYGPTEATIDATCELDVRPDGRGLAPIGRPIANACVHVLDPEGRPVADGRAGELYVGGRPVARGYAGRPGLTAERFVPDPFAPPGQAGARLYRTGDAARRLAGGSLEFLGRTDQQVKVHGVRIEPAEIESALRERPEVREAAVVAEERPAGGQRLVAYVATASLDRTALARRLREHLRARLPAAMVPSYTIVLDALPRTPNGKLDRLHLPTAAAGAEPDAEFVAPRTPLERSLADTFARVLGVERLGVHDTLFDHGADSLVVAQMGTHVISTHDVQLPLFVLFSEPTVAGVARMVEAYARHGGEHVNALSASLIEAEAVLDPSVVPEWEA